MFRESNYSDDDFEESSHDKEEIGDISKTQEPDLIVHHEFKEIPLSEAELAFVEAQKSKVKLINMKCTLFRLLNQSFHCVSGQLG